jgi:hypothetical protein
MLKWHLLKLSTWMTTLHEGAIEESVIIFYEGRVMKLVRGSAPSRFLVTGFILIISVFSSGGAKNYADQVSLAWDATTTNSDGSPHDLAGYKIYFGTASGQYSSYLDVGNVLTYSLTGLSAETAYFLAVTAYDTFGVESEYSNEVVYNAPYGVPALSLPGILLVTGALGGVLLLRGRKGRQKNGT